MATDDRTMASYLFTVPSSNRSHQNISGDYHCHRFGDKVVMRKCKDGQAFVLIPRTKDGQSLICAKHYDRSKDRNNRCCPNAVIVDRPVTMEKMAAALKRFKGRCAFQNGFAISGDDGFEDHAEEMKRKTEMRLETSKRKRKEEEQQTKQLIINPGNTGRPLTRSAAKRANVSNAPQVVAVAQSLAPGDIATQPGTKIVFNAPYDDKHTYHIKIINSSARRIGFTIKTTSMKRLPLDRACGVLDPKEEIVVCMNCNPFDYGQEDTTNDRVMIEWTNSPAGAAKQFRHDWFQGDGMEEPSHPVQPLECNEFMIPLSSLSFPIDLLFFCIMVAS